MKERDEEGLSPAGPEAERISPEAERVRSVLRAAAPGRPDPAFREQLKRDFVSGAIQVTGTKDRRRSDERARRGRDAKVRRVIRLKRPPTFAWIGASIAAAAALLLVLGALNRGSTWWVTAARGDGIVRVDGQEISLDDRDAMRRMLKPGAEIEVTGNAELDLCCDGVVAVQLAPGTRMTLPPPPGRWVGRNTELYARGGELRVTTGPRFEGARLEIFSPSAAVLVTGTTLAVIIEDAGTCVCVFDGTALVGRARGGRQTDMRPVAGGSLRYVYEDDRSPASAGMRPEERTKLASFRESQRPWLKGTASQD
jgi:hypothetical protein